MYLKILNNNRSNILLLIALFAFNDLFYAERFGLNILIFLLLIFTFQVVLFKESFQNRKVLLGVGLTIFTAAMLVWHNSLLSKWMFFLSYTITLGFIIQPKLRFIGYSILTSASNYLRLPFEIFTWNKTNSISEKRGFKFARAFLLSIIPVIIGLIFYIIYRVANPIFAELTDKFWIKIGDWIENVFKHISMVRILFILFGVVILSGIIYTRNASFFANEEEQFTDTIERKRDKVRLPFLSSGFMNEYLSGIILLVIMNLMLLVLNAIDIKYIWINFEIPSGVSLSEMVHQGTEWLIVSIILSIVVVIYLFRANQNFYSKSKWLKLLAYAWMAQNIILTVSLLMRNNMYVSWHALAYKRLGVYVFIALTFIGLVTMLIKINKAKSFFYLLRINAWAAYLIMCGVCCINWDIFIAKYNVEFEKGSQLDTDFLLKLSPKAYPYIYDKLDKVGTQIKAHENNSEIRGLYYYNAEQFRDQLDHLSRIYIAENSDKTWRSYNVADHYALEYLKTKIKP